MACQGEQFRTVRGLPFTYAVVGNQVVPDRTGYPLHQVNFRKAYEAGRVPGPGALEKDIMGPSSVWAILDDRRMSGWSR